jgi:hypothetical protein
MHKMLIFQKINSLVQGGIALEEGILFFDCLLREAF